MPRYTLIGRNEFPSTQPERAGKMDVVYAYQDERLQTIIIQFPIEEDSPERVEEELRKRVAAAREAGPRTLEIE